MATFGGGKGPHKLFRQPNMLAKNQVLKAVKKRYFSLYEKGINFALGKSYDIDIFHSNGTLHMFFSNEKAFYEMVNDGNHPLLMYDQPNDEMIALQRYLKNAPRCVVQKKYNGRILTHIPAIEDLNKEQVELLQQSPADKLSIHERILDGSIAADIHQSLYLQIDKLQIPMVPYAQVAKLLEKQWMINEQAKEVHSDSASNFFEAYRNYQETVEFLNTAVSRGPQGNTRFSMSSIGKSIQGNDILACRIYSDKHSTPKPAIVVIGGQQGNQWLGISSCTFLCHAMLNYSFKEVLEDFDIHVIPVANPDGHIRSHTIDMWDEARVNSRGIDLTMNWSKRQTPCSPIENFASVRCRCGPGSPLSEPETSSIIKYVHELPAGVAGMMDVRGHGRKLIKSHHRKAHEEYLRFISDEVGAAMSKIQIPRIAAELALPYSTVGAEYLTTSSAADYFYDTFNCPSLTVELPPRYNQVDGSAFFSLQPHPSCIQHVGNSLAVGVAHFAKMVKAKPFPLTNK